MINALFNGHIIDHLFDAFNAVGELMKKPIAVLFREGRPA